MWIFLLFIIKLLLYLFMLPKHLDVWTELKCKYILEKYLENGDDVLLTLILKCSFLAACNPNVKV